MPSGAAGGNAVLFTSHSQVGGNFNDANIEVLSLTSGERKVVHRGGFFGHYLPSGHLVFMNGSTLFAVPFDLEEPETRGSPAHVVQSLAGNIVEGAAQASFSNTGSLVYLAGESTFPKYPVVWVDREGTTEPLLDELGSYANPRDLTGRMASVSDRRAGQSLGYLGLRSGTRSLYSTDLGRSDRNGAALVSGRTVWADSSYR